MTDNALNKPASPTIRLTAWAFVALFLSAVVGSCVAKVEVVARGEGRIVPTERVKVVQPLVDGKIAAILVAEGQSVKKGAPLIEMDTTSARSEIKRIEAEVGRQSQEKSVALSIIGALAVGDPGDDGFVERGKSALARQIDNSGAGRVGAEALVLAILSALHNQIAQIDAQKIRTGRAELAQLARLEKARSERDIIASRLVSVESLRKEGTISEGEYMERLRVVRAAEGDAVIAERQLSELRAEAEANDRQRASAISEVHSTYQKQLSAADIALGSLVSDLQAAHERLENLSLRAPEAGRIENLSVFTVGSFVEAGATLLSVVPAGGDIEVEAFFDNRDIGFLEIGQLAFIKLDAFPAERFGLVRGKVTGVGADAREQAASRKWVYAVRLKLDQTGIKVADRRIDFVPGMTAIVDVVTGERRLISYFFEPVVKAVQDSFGEQ